MGSSLPVLVLATSSRLLVTSILLLICSAKTGEPLMQRSCHKRLILNRLGMTNTNFGELSCEMCPVPTAAMVSGEIGLFNLSRLRMQLRESWRPKLQGPRLKGFSPIPGVQGSVLDPRNFARPSFVIAHYQK